MMGKVISPVKKQQGSDEDDKSKRFYNGGAKGFSEEIFDQGFGDKNTFLWRNKMKNTSTSCDIQRLLHYKLGTYMPNKLRAKYTYIIYGSKIIFVLILTIVCITVWQIVF